MKLFPTQMAACKVVSWNAAALFQLDRRRARTKVAALNSLAKDTDWILLQEVHGIILDLRAWCPQVVDTFVCHYSQSLRLAVRGVAALIKNSWLEVNTAVENEVPAQGRVIRATVDTGGRRLTCW